MLEAPFVESLEGISISSFFNLRRCEMFHGEGREGGVYGGIPGLDVVQRRGSRSCF